MLHAHTQDVVELGGQSTRKDSKRDEEKDIAG